MVYKHTSINMSKEQLSTALYWCVMLDAVITATYTLGKNFNRKQNSRNTVWLVLGFKDELLAAQFEEKTGFKLDNPPRINLNDTQPL